MKCLNLQDHQAKTHNYGKGLAYLKNRATTSQNQILHLQKMKKKKKTHSSKKKKKKNQPKKQKEKLKKKKKKKKTKKKKTRKKKNKKKKKKRKEEWRTIESTGTRGSNGNK